ncbi:MAG: hypothetical protein JNG90_00105 [Planctomycetaceae bacterium]|nr:hypothetical protein [Planctomycetaceae bacterium]
MEARLLRGLAAASALLFLGASYRTPNFVVTAPTPEFAKQVGDEAERFRRELAVLWLGQALPKWAQPCPITLQVGPTLGAGGATSFVFDHGEVFNWQMSIQGSEERILDSVLPHEVTHTIFASYFRQPLPRWADEGACTTVEHESERAKQRQMLISFLKEDRGIAFSRMFAMKEYPPDVMPLYAQGFSLCRFLIDQRDRRTFIRFLSEGLQTNAWNAALQNHYGFNDIAQLQGTWLEWVKAGSPLNRRTPEQGGDATLLASSSAPAANAPAPSPARPSAYAAAEPGPAADAQQLAAAAPPAGALVPIRKPQASELLAAAEPRPEPQVDLSPVVPAVERSVQPVQLTRPQPPQQAQGRVLEWTQPAPGIPASSEVAATGSAPPAPTAAANNTRSAATSPHIKLSGSAAQRYLPAAMSRPRATPPAAPARLAPTQQAVAEVTTGEI